MEEQVLQTENINSVSPMFPKILVVVVLIFVVAFGTIAYGKIDKNKKMVAGYQTKTTQKTTISPTIVPTIDTYTKGLSQ